MQKDLNIYLYLIKYFSQKSSLIDVGLSSKYASHSLDIPCQMTPLNSFILQCLCHKQFVLQNLHSFINTTCVTPLLDIGMLKIESK